LARPLGRPASPNPVPQNFLHGRLIQVMFLDKAWSRPPRPLPRLQTNMSLPSR
jgi:hypothetical protein